MFTTGVGSLVDLPQFSVLVRGLDDWNYDLAGEWEPIAEPRLVVAAQRLLRNRSITELRPAPWLDGIDQQPKGPASTVGVPAAPFPSWLRCTVCNELASVSSRTFGFENRNPRRPHDARFFHDNCSRKRSGRPPLAVASRFVLACTAGHLDDFPYVEFVHQGGECTEATHPRLRMADWGGNLGANVTITCISCEAKRNMREAMGVRGEQNLPFCRGRHPHLGTFEQGGCQTGDRPKTLVVGASNQWFSQTLTVLSVPRTGARELDDRVDRHWDDIAPLPKTMYGYARNSVPAFRELSKWSDDEIADAVERVRAHRDGGTEDEAEPPDLLAPEWEIFSAAQLPEVTDDFALRRDPDGVPAALKNLFDDVIQVERLREVRALVGFTRLDAPDPDDPDLVQRAPLARSDPQWLPASEVRGEGIFLRVPQELLTEWEQRVSGSEALELHREAYAQFRRNRYSDRIAGPFEPMRHWPGARYYALHTLSHLLIRTIALDCGYSSASLSERIYAGTEDDSRSGILIYTAVPDAEGTLGGLVSQAEPDRLISLMRQALHAARRCSSDPLCAERLPHPPADFLHGAACHVCLFVSETTCERGNRFLDRRFVVPIDDPALALYTEVP
jgi:hypothetical protein